MLIPHNYKIPPMLINLSNHPFELWSNEQREAALRFGECMDLPFPVVDPTGDEAYIDALANTYCKKVLSLVVNSNRTQATVHLMGEMTFTYALLKRLELENITCIASTSARNVVELTNGQKEVQFLFVKFRHYV